MITVTALCLMVISLDHSAQAQGGSAHGQQLDAVLLRPSFVVCNSPSMSDPSHHSNLAGEHAAKTVSEAIPSHGSPPLEGGPSTIGLLNHLEKAGELAMFNGTLNIGPPSFFRRMLYGMSYYASDLAAWWHATTDSMPETLVIVIPLKPVAAAATILAMLSAVYCIAYSSGKRAAAHATPAATSAPSTPAPATRLDAPTALPTPFKTTPVVPPSAEKPAAATAASQPLPPPQPAATTPPPPSPQEPDTITTFLLNDIKQWRSSAPHGSPRTPTTQRSFQSDLSEVRKWYMGAPANEGVFRQLGRYQAGNNSPQAGPKLARDADVFSYVRRLQPEQARAVFLELFSRETAQARKLFYEDTLI